MGDVKKFIELEAKAPIVELTNVPATIPYQIGMLQNIEENRRLHRLRCIEIAYKEVLSRCERDPLAASPLTAKAQREDLHDVITEHVNVLMGLYDDAVMESLERQNEMRAHFAAVCDAMRAKAGGAVS